MKDCIMKTQSLNNQLYTFLEKGGGIQDEKKPKKLCGKIIKVIIYVNLLILFIGAIILVSTRSIDDLDVAKNFFNTKTKNDDVIVNNDTKLTTIEPLETFQLDIFNSNNNVNLDSLISEAETLRQQVLLEIRMADSMEGGWNEIIDSDIIQLQKNATYLIVKYLFKDDDADSSNNNHQIDNQKIINEAEIISSRLNWIMVNIYSNDELWNYKFISKSLIEFKVLNRWRNLINRIYDWKYRVIKNNIIFPNELPTLAEATAANNKWLLENNIDFKKPENVDRSEGAEDKKQV
ncbi:hypothetical protein HCN44_010631 [Aphidius gifuensis]|uniref:Uncharacterized protein n=1 Tax=Aphidius gifuensis TaxID=684658 RepID=A0A834XQZ0_APHGI|nr:hypothetical protein HCN44_010631 [Aphidius gifuensis]